MQALLAIKTSNKNGFAGKGGQFFKGFFFNFDLYGYSPALTIKGEETSKSVLGIIISFAIYAVFLAYVYEKGSKLIFRLDPDILVTQNLRNMDDISTFSPKEAGFDFAFTLKKELDPTVAYFEVKKIKEYYLSNGTKVNTTTNMTIEKCKNENFNFQNKTQLSVLQLEKYYYCLRSDQEYEIGGNQLSQEFQYLQIKLLKCSGSVSLPTTYPKPGNKLRNLQQTQEMPLPRDLQINLPNLPTPTLTPPTVFQSLKCGLASAANAVINNQNFNFIFVNQNFAPESMDEPIKQFLDDTLYIEMEPNKNKKADLYIKQQTATFLDDVFQIIQPDDQDFAQVDNIRFYDSATSAGDNTILTINIKLDKVQNEFTRQVYSILGFLGDIGGLQGILYLMGFYFVSSFAERAYYRKVIAETLQVQESDLIKKKNKKKIRSNQIMSNSNNHQQQHLNQLDQNPQNGQKSQVRQSFESSPKIKLQVIEDDKNFDSQAFSTSKQDTDQQNLINKFVKNDIKIKLKNNQNAFAYYSDLLINHLTNRFKFNYGPCLLTALGLRLGCFIKICGCFCSRQRKEIKIIQKSEEKVQNELCVINILKTLKKVQILEKILLNKHQRSFMKYQKEWVVDQKSESSSSEDNYDGPTFLNDKRKHKNKMTNLKKQFLKEHLYPYQMKKELSTVDKKLISGTISRKRQRDYEGSQSPSEDELRNLNQANFGVEGPNHEDQHIDQSVSGQFYQGNNLSSNKHSLIVDDLNISGNLNEPQNHIYNHKTDNIPLGLQYNNTHLTTLGAIPQQTQRNDIQYNRRENTNHSPRNIPVNNSNNVGHGNELQYQRLQNRVKNGSSDINVNSLLVNLSQNNNLQTQRKY
eukprot:403353286